MNRKKYLIKLFPLDTFFFGGEHTFGEGQKANYFAKSNLYPQQSALLGMLRYQILKKTNLLGPGADQAQVKACIGLESFKLYNGGRLQCGRPDFSFGRIKALSPLFLLETKPEKEEFYFPMPLDYGYKTPFPPTESVRLCLNGKKLDITATSVNKNPVAGQTPAAGSSCPTSSSGPDAAELRAFDHKTYCNYDCWLGAGVDRPVKKTGEIWLPSTKIGITKRGDNESDKDNFYKQTVFKLQNDFCFAFYTIFEEEAGEQLLDQESFVFLGGQRSVFLMKAKEILWPATACDEPEICVTRELLGAYPPVTGEKIVLAGDTYVENMPELMQLCRFAWSDSVVFRNIQTSVGENRNYYAKPTKSSKYVFLKRGSVLYLQAGKIDEAARLLDNKYLQLAGYNIYIKSNESSN